jgi:hypothetical protein
MKSSKRVTITLEADVIRAIANEMRRIPPRDSQTDQFVANVVHWFEHIIENPTDG